MKSWRIKIEAKNCFKKYLVIIFLLEKLKWVNIQIFGFNWHKCLQKWGRMRQDIFLKCGASGD